MPKTFRSVSEKDDKFFISTKKFFSFSTKASSGHVECSFQEQADKFFCQRPKVFCSRSENDRRSIIYSKENIKSFCWTRRMQFWQPRWRFLSKCRKHFAQYPRKMINSFFKRKRFFPFFFKMFFSTYRIHFRQTRSKLVAKWPNISCWRSKMLGEQYLFREFFFNFFLWTRRMQFWKIWKIFVLLNFSFGKSRKVLPQNTKKMTNSFSDKKIFSFSTKSSSERVESSFQRQRRGLSAKGKKIRSMSENDNKLNFPQQNFFQPFRRRKGALLKILECFSSCCIFFAKKPKKLSHYPRKITKVCF